MRVVVAYDDDPDRYDRLANQCKRLGWLFVCVEHPDALMQLLNYADVLAVLLDHDLRDLNGETFTGVQVAHECIVPRQVPVIVTSANNAGAAKIAEVLREACSPVRVISVTETMPEERWIGQLALWAAKA